MELRVAPAPAQLLLIERAHLAHRRAEDHARGITLGRDEAGRNGPLGSEGLGKGNRALADARVEVDCAEAPFRVLTEQRDVARMRCRAREEKRGRIAHSLEGLHHLGGLAHVAEGHPALGAARARFRDLSAKVQRARSVHLHLDAEVLSAAR